MTSPVYEFQKLQRDLYRMGPASRRRLAKTFRDAGDPMLVSARARAYWSSRIPGAISVTATVGTNDRIGVQLRISAAKAPHARSYEGIEGNATFRHPVFGHIDRRWPTENTRPYGWPAVRVAAGRIQPAIEAAFADAARECGFH